MTRRTLLFLTILAVGAIPSTAGAQVPQRGLEGAGDGIELNDGRGTAIAVSRDGAMFGNVARGKIVIVDMLRGERTAVVVNGCERSRRFGRTRVCIGRDLRFSVLEGRWRTTVTGTGINATGVIEGSLTLKGTGGTFTLGEAEPRRWPRRARTFLLG